VHDGSKVDGYGSPASRPIARPDPFGAGVALEVLWWIAVIILVVWLLDFMIRPAASGGRRSRWYRWSSGPLGS
jgi:hypothetical protein